MGGAGRRVALLIALGLAIVAPLPFGAVGPGARAGLALAVATGLILLLVDRREFGSPPTHLAALSAATLLLAAVYLVPLPPAVIGAVSPSLAGRARAALAAPGAPEGLREAERVMARAAGGSAPDGSWRPLAADPDGSLEGTTRLLLVVGSFLLGLFAAGEDRTARRRLAVALGVSAFAQAAYGLAESLSGSHSIFGWVNPFYGGLASGTFVCPNHFAALLSLGLFAQLGLLASRRTHHGPDREPGDEPQDGEVRARTAVIVTACGVIVIGMLWSSSRAALGAAAIALIALGAVLLVRRGVTLRGAVVLVVQAVLVIALVGGAVLLRPVQPLVTDFEQTSSGITDREQVWHLGASIVRAFPVLGAGPGTFEAVHRAFRPASLGVTVAHAHNDYLEWLAETGVIGLLLLGAWIVAVAWNASRLFRRGRDRALTAALACALGALAIHEVFDFSLQLPGVAIPAALLAGALLGPLPLLPVPASAPREGRGWPALLAVTALGLLGAAVLSLAWARTPVAGTRPSAVLSGPEQRIDWARMEVDTVAASVTPQGAPTAAQRARLGDALLAAQRAAHAAPLRSDAQIACWVATQAVAAAARPADPPPGFDALSRHYLAQAVALDPANRGRRFQVARYWLAYGDGAEARRQVKDLLEMDAAWSKRAYELLGGAGAELADLMQATPNRPRAAVQLANYLAWTRNDLPGAQLVLERALPRATQDAELRRTLAAVLSARGRTVEALALMTSGPTPSDPTEQRYALQMRCSFLARLGRTDELEPLLERLAKAGEEPARVALLRATGRVVKEDHAGAIDVLQRALDDHAQAPSTAALRLELLLMLGREQRAAGQLGDALGTYRTAEKLAPENAEVRAFMASLDPDTR